MFREPVCLKPLLVGLIFTKGSFLPVHPELCGCRSVQDYRRQDLAHGVQMEGGVVISCHSVGFDWPKTPGGACISVSTML